MPLRLYALVTLGLVACSGHEGSSCSDSSECSGSLECAGPSEGPTCGIPARELCASDTDCEPPLVCQAIPDPCSDDGVGSECRPPCTEGACGDGFRCHGGACEAVPCDEGTPCPAHQACDPAVPASDGPVHRRAAGCVAIPCAATSQCPSGTDCVNAVCQAGPGRCVEPQLVP